jgi:hypothetical protein
MTDVVTIEKSDPAWRVRDGKITRHALTRRAGAYVGGDRVNGTLLPGSQDRQFVDVSLPLGQHSGSRRTSPSLTNIGVWLS